LLSKIFRVVNKDTNEKKVCKKLTKSKIFNFPKFKEEIRVLSQIDHPNVIKLHEIYEDPSDIYLMMEECTGDSLFERISENSSSKKVISEKTIALLFKQIVDALNHCHIQGIYHKDLKPENIIFVNKDEKSPLKIIDFGLGMNSSKGNSVMIKKIHSPHYAAPEVLEGEYDCKCDIWSAGVILYNLVSGMQPFDGKNEAEIFTSIKSKKVYFPCECKENLSNKKNCLLI